MFFNLVKETDRAGWYTETRKWRDCYVKGMFFITNVTLKQSIGKLKFKHSNLLTRIGILFYILNIFTIIYSTLIYKYIITWFQ